VQVTSSFAPLFFSSLVSTDHGSLLSMPYAMGPQNIPYATPEQFHAAAAFAAQNQPHQGHASDAQVASQMEALVRMSEEHRNQQQRFTGNHGKGEARGRASSSSSSSSSSSPNMLRTSPQMLSSLLAQVTEREFSMLHRRRLDINLPSQMSLQGMLPGMAHGYIMKNNAMQNLAIRPHLATAMGPGPASADHGSAQSSTQPLSTHSASTDHAETIMPMHHLSGLGKNYHNCSTYLFFSIQL